MDKVNHMYACIHTPDFSVQAALRMRQELRQAPVVILDGEVPLEIVIGTNAYARKIGVALGMRRLQADSFDHLYLLKRCRAQEDAAQSALLACAGSFSPRIEPVFFEYVAEPGGTLTLDISGTEKLFGSAETLAKKLRKQAAEVGLHIQIAVSKNFHAAVSAARGFPGITIIPPGKEAEMLGTLPLNFLDLSPEMAETFELWGVRTFAALAALSERELIARIGQQGQQLSAIVRGEFSHLLVPAEPSFASQLHETIELDYPVELIEPLLFLFHRMVDQLLVRVKSRALAIASITIQLTLDPATNGNPVVHQRTIRPALPVQDAQTLLKLIQLDLEMHPPAAAVSAVHMEAEPARPQVAQNGLFLPQGPAAERLEILLARLRKLVGEERVGSPQLFDTHKPDSFRMNTFTPQAGKSQEKLVQTSPVALRLCRPPQAIAVTAQAGKLIQVALASERYNVLQQAGPWRASGQWWSNERWCREEWDVTLSNNTEVMICRIAHDPGSQCWYMQGVYD
jgi:protein ImuB